jgi:(S)-2-hydroxyglutarate dehydrogenase
VPEVEEEDLFPTEAGVRAQALTKDGELVDDF